MRSNYRIILIGIILLVNLYSIAADNISENGNDLYLKTNLFSMNFQSLSGNDTYKYNQLFGVSDEMIEHINLNEKINFELKSAKYNTTRGNIFYWTGLVSMCALPIVAMNDPTPLADGIDIATYYGSLGISTIIAFIGIKYFATATTHINKAVTLYNVVN